MNAQTLVDISEAAIKKAQEILAGDANGAVRKDISSSSGFAAYDLQPVAVLLQPFLTPLRNMLPRVKNTRGGNSAEWRVISAITTALTDPTVSSEGAAGNRVNYSATAVTAAFAELALGDRVTWAAEDAAKGFEGDLRAKAVTNLLKAFMQQEEKQLLFGRIANLGSVTAPTVSTSSTGGTIAAGTYKVTVRAIIGLADGTNTRGRKSSSTTTSALTGATNSMTAHTPYVEGAVQYEWYVDDGASGTSTLQATTGINSVSLTALTTSGAALPADNVANAAGMKGLVANLPDGTAGYVKTLATGTDGVGTDFVLDDIDTANKSVWDNNLADPEVILVNSTQMARMTNLWLAANGGPVSYVVPDKGNLGALTGGYRLTGYVNKITGREQRIITHPYLPSGTIVGLTQEIPFPTGGDQVAIDIETSRDYQQVDYALTARRWDFEVFSRECLRLKFPGGAWVIRNASAKTTA